MDFESGISPRMYATSPIFSNKVGIAVNLDSYVNGKIVPNVDLLTLASKALTVQPFKITVLSSSNFTIKNLVNATNSQRPIELNMNLDSNIIFERTASLNVTVINPNGQNVEHSDLSYTRAVCDANGDVTFEKLVSNVEIQAQQSEDVSAAAVEKSSDAEDQQVESYQVDSVVFNSAPVHSLSIPSSAAIIIPQNPLKVLDTENQQVETPQFETFVFDAIPVHSPAIPTSTTTNVPQKPLLDEYRHFYEEPQESTAAGGPLVRENDSLEALKQVFDADIAQLSDAEFIELYGMPKLQWESLIQEELGIVASEAQDVAAHDPLQEVEAQALDFQQEPSSFMTFIGESSGTFDSVPTVAQCSPSPLSQFIHSHL